MENFLSWEDVVATHGVISGISSKHGFVKSLLCNTGQDQKYPNKIRESQISYYVGPNTRSSGINALFNSLERKDCFPVFEKLGVNKWRNLGIFKIVSAKEEKGGYALFELVKN